MRVSAVYVHRCSSLQPLGVLLPCSSTKHGNHDDHCVPSVCGKIKDSGSVQENDRDTHTQEPAAKVRRTELVVDLTSDSPNTRLDTASVGATRSILQGMLNFFKRKEPSPSISLPTKSQPPVPFSLRNIFLGSDHENQQQAQLKQQDQLLPPTRDTSENKENIPPVNHEQSSAVTALQTFRQDESLKRRRQESDKPKPTTGILPTPELPHALTTASKEAGLGARKKTAGVTKKPSRSLRRSKREDGKGPVQVSQRQFLWFIQLAESPKIINFLKRDICYRYADKYLLAIAFTYFVRARLRKDQYTKNYFYAALYLAHDMEEDEEELKYEVFPWALGTGWRKTYPSLLKVRDEIFWAIHCRAVVSKRGCDQVMAMQPGCWIWQRERPGYHGGALREYLKDPSDNGRPRGPEKSPLQCQLCLERECANSQNSYLIYFSDSSMDSLCLDIATVTEHKEGDSGFETFLFEQCDASSLMVSVDNTLKRCK